EATLPLRRDIAAMLRPYLAGRGMAAPVWPGSWYTVAAKMLRRDLERAGIAYVDGDGRFRDFHSLRHRFGTGLALANTPVRVAQSLMRHSTVTLTMDRYARAGLHDVAGAVDSLSPPPDGHLAHHLPTEGGGSGRDGADAGVAAIAPIGGS